MKKALTTGLPLVILLLCMISHSATAQLVSPCSCSSYVNIGTSVASETDITEVSVGVGDVCIYIQGTLTISQPTNWSYKRIRMGTGSQIVVESSFFLSYSHIRSCDDLWKGIYLEDETFLSFTDNEIADAEFAIFIEDDASLICQNNEFVDNYIGIACGSPFDACLINNDYLREVSVKGSVVGNEFHTETALHDPYFGQYYYPSWPTDNDYDQGFAAAFLCNSVGLNIGAKGASSAQRNSIHHLRNAVVVVGGSETIVISNDIEDMVGDPTSFDDGTLPYGGDEFLDLFQFGIFGHLSVLNVVDNDISGTWEGVFSFRSENEVWNNTIDVGFGRACVEVWQATRANIHENEIIDGWKGIWLADYDATGYSIRENDIDRMAIMSRAAGIEVSNARGPGTISDNLIDITVNGSSYGAFHTGIVLLFSQRAHVESNTITFDNPSASSAFWHVGILAHETGLHVIEHNVISANGDLDEDLSDAILNISSVNTWHCQSTEGFQYGWRFIGAPGFSTLTANSIGYADIGFQIDAPTFIGTQYLHGNVWPSSYNSWGAFILAANASDALDVAMESRFIVEADGGINGYQLPPTIGPPAVEDDWFIPGEGVAKTCDYGPPDDFDVDADTLVKFLLNGPEFDTLQDEMTWLLKHSILQAIRLQDTLRNNSTLDSFYDAETILPLGKLVASLDSLLSVHGMQRTTMDSIEVECEGLTDDLIDIDSILNIHPHDSASWIALRILKVDTLAALMEIWQEIIANERNASEAAWSDVISILDTLKTSNDFEEYYSASLMLMARVKVGNSVSTSDSSQLRALAGRCIMEGGPSIAISESVVAAAGDTLTPGYLSCQMGGSRARLWQGVQPDVSHEGLSIYPNPANEYIDILSENVISEISLISLNGQILRSVRPNAHSFTMNLSTYPSGLYFVTVVNEGTDDSKTLRIIITR